MSEKTHDLIEFLNAVGDRIARIRQVRGMSRDDLADATGLTYAGIYATETRGQGTQIDTIYKIAKALDVSPGVILDGGTITRNAEVVV